MNPEDQCKTVMHVIDSGGLYGAERVLLDLAARTQLRDGWRVVVAPIISPNDTVDALGIAAEQRGLEVIRFYVEDGMRPFQFANVFRRANRENVSLIHSHGYRCNILCALQPERSRSIPMVCTLHGWTSESMFSRMRVYEILEKCLLHRFDRVISVSQALGRKVRYLVADDRLRFIENGVSVPDSIAPELPPNVASFIENQFAILAVGRLSREKGFDLLIEAMGSIIASTPESRLVLVGEGPEIHNLKDQVRRLGLGKFVLFAGYCKHISSMMERFDLLVISSRTEGLPLVLLEALSSKLPVIAANVGAIPGVLESGRLGRLVPPNNACELSNAIIEVTSEYEEALEVARMAVDRTSSTYSIERMEFQYHQTYREIMKCMPK